MAWLVLVVAVALCSLLLHVFFTFIFNLIIVFFVLVALWVIVGHRDGTIVLVVGRSATGGRQYTRPVGLHVCCIPHVRGTHGAETHREGKSDDRGEHWHTATEGQRERERNA
jgi:hypothetical protein